MLTGRPFDDLHAVVQQLPEGDLGAAQAISDNLGRKPLAPARGLADLLTWLGLWQGVPVPTVADTHICMLVSSYQHVPGGALMARDYIDMASKGRAPVNLMCVDRGIGLRVIELAPEVPHRNDGTWRDADCMAAFAFGMEAAAAGGDLLGLCDLAPGNEVGAAALVAYCTGMDIGQAGSGCGPLAVAAHTLLTQAELPADAPLDALRILGGREIAAVLGALVAARSRRLPVLADGWASLAAVAILNRLKPGAADHVRFAGAESAFQHTLMAASGHPALIGALVGVGPGCAVASAVPLLAAACAVLAVPDTTFSHKTH